MRRATSRVAVVLSGGGAYGAYEVGVLRALVAGHCPATRGRGLEFGQLAGTSVGAFNASVVAANAADGLPAAVDRLSAMWRQEVADRDGSCGNGVYRVRGLPTGLFDPACLRDDPARVLSDLIRDTLDALRGGALWLRRWLTSSESFTRRTVEQLDLSAILDTTPFARLLERAITPDGVRGGGLRLRVIATNFDTGALVVFDEKAVGAPGGWRAVMASAALPGIFPPVEIDGELHVDGATLLNTPIRPIVQEADEIHVVYLDPDVDRIPRENLRSTIGVVDRLILTGFAASMNHDIEAVRDLNRSLSQIRSHRAGSTLPGSRFQRIDDLARELAVPVARAGFRELTIHRYHPHDFLGGTLGTLDFDLDRVEGLMERGFRDAVEHDCVECECIFPEGARS